MFRKKTALAVAAYMLLGSFCVAPAALAAESIVGDRNGEEMEQVTEMVMTPAKPMSPLHCTGCVTITRPHHHSNAGNTLPCNAGHCLSEHTPSIAASTQSPLKNPTKAALLPASSVYSEELNDRIHRTQNGSVPVQVSFVQTVVLRE